MGEAEEASLHLLRKPSFTALDQRVTVVLGSAASASQGNLLEMQILRPHCGPVDSETLGVAPSHLCINEPFQVILMLTQA